MYRLLRRKPERAIAFMFPDTAEKIAQNKEKIELAIMFMEASLPMSLREEGTYNDLTEKNSFPLELLEDIRVPTFIVHGTKDRWAPPETAERAAELIPRAELTLFEGDHIFFIAQKEKFREYLRECLKGLD
jgi:pimeloyl-ACP methyl ester carboxylesterase